MTKTILVIKGSYRENGFTNRIWKDAVRDLENTEIKIFDTYSHKFKFCKGCNYCEEAGKCVYRDLDEFFKTFENADVIIFSSPVYNGSFAAPVKAIIDRFQVYYTSFYKNAKTQPIKKHRKVILLAAAGRKGKEALEEMEKNLKCACTILNSELVGSVLCYDTDETPDYETPSKELKSILKRSFINE